MATQIRRSPEQWQHHINAQLSSGLSIKRYCQKHQLTPSSFYLWRSRLAEEVNVSPEPSMTRDWLPISLNKNDAAVAQYSTNITLALPGGITLTICSR